LKHHRHIALARRYYIDAPTTKMDFAAAQRFKASDHPQQGRFAAAGWSEEYRKFAVCDL
jgi:hypothetical protein